MKIYRVAILGCGGRGKAAALAYHEHPRTSVVGLCDLEKDMRDKLGTSIGVTARYDDLDLMISETNPDIVAIPTGTEFHYELCMRVLEHGVNIEVEKPMTIDLEQADQIIAKAKDKGARIAVHHQGRVGGAMKATYLAYKSGKIGELRYISGSGKGYYGGYGLMNIGTHTLNAIFKLGGHCRSVNSVLSTDGRPVTPEDVIPSPSGMGTIAGEFITANLHLQGNVTATLLQHRFPEMATIGGERVGHTMEFFGTEGRIFLQGHANAWVLSEPHRLPEGNVASWEALEKIFPDSYNESNQSEEDDYWFVEEYVNALDENRDHECSGVEALHVIETMMGIFESGAYGKRIDLPQQNRQHPLVRWRAENGLGMPDKMPRKVPEWLEAEDQRLGRR